MVPFERVLLITGVIGLAIASRYFLHTIQERVNQSLIRTYEAKHRNNLEELESIERQIAQTRTEIAEYKTKLNHFQDFIVSVEKFRKKFQMVAGKNSFPSDADLIRLTKNKREFDEVLETLEELTKRSVVAGAPKFADFMLQVREALIDIKQKGHSPFLAKLRLRTQEIMMYRKEMKEGMIVSPPIESHQI